MTEKDGDGMSLAMFFVHFLIGGLGENGLVGGIGVIRIPMVQSKGARKCCVERVHL